MRQCGVRAGGVVHVRIAFAMVVICRMQGMPVPRSIVLRCVTTWMSTYNLI